MTAPLPSSSPHPGRERLTLWLCFVVAMIEGYDLQVLAIAGPALRAAMQLDPRQMGLAFGASLVGLALGAAVGGMLADRIGRKSVLLGSLLGLSMLTLATAWANDFQALMTLRILAGLAMGGAMPNLIAISASAARDQLPTTKVAVMMGGMPAGGVIAALGGGALIPRLGWHGVFVVGGVITALIVPVLWRWLVAPSSEGRPAQTSALGWRQVLFHQGRAVPTLLLWLSFILTLAIFSTLAGWVPTLVVDKGMPAAVGYQSLMAINLGGIAGTLVLSWCCDRWGIRRVMLTTFIAMAVSLVLFSHTSVAGTAVPLAALVGFWVLGAQTTLYGISPRMYPPAGHSTGVGCAVAAGRIGSISGPIIAGYAMGMGTSASQLILALAPLAVLAGLVLWALAQASGNVMQLMRHGRT